MFFVILVRMNGFRVTILVLFCLTVGLMFYAVAVVLPNQQERYSLYQTTMKNREYEQRDDEHRVRMEQLAPESEAPEVESARNAAEESERQREQALNEAEESSVIASAKRKQEEREARQAAQTVRENDEEQIRLGTVKGFDAEWNALLFAADADTPVANGLEIAVSREGKIICEAVVDGRDEESGQFSATVKQVELGAALRQMELPTPSAGDMVIVSPFLSGKQLRVQNNHFGTSSQPSTPAEQPLPEVEASLTPVP